MPEHGVEGSGIPATFEVPLCKVADLQRITLNTVEEGVDWQ